MIKLYTQDGCGPCHAARKYLDALDNVAYKEVNISGSTGNLVEMYQFCEEKDIPMATPLLVMPDGRYVKGFERADDYLETLRDATIDSALNENENDTERSNQEIVNEENTMEDVKNRVEEAAPEGEVEETPAEETTEEAAE